jgi:hypothetical protein
LTSFPLRAGGVVVIAATIAVSFLPAQDLHRNGSMPTEDFPSLAPPVPAPTRQLDLLVSAPESVAPPGSDLEVIRYGHGGSVLRPAALDLPGEISAISLHRWDWLHLDGRDLEIALRAPYRRWLRMHAGSQGIIVSADRLELLGGTVDWLDETVDADFRSVSSGPVAVVGRGTARIIRDSGEVTVAVGVGRFEIERAGRLVAVLGPGQRGTFPTVEVSSDSGTAEGVPDLESTLPGLRSALNTALEQLLSQESLAGEDAAALWEAIVRTGPAYFAAHRSRDPSVPAPDAIRREIGEALRLIGAYPFEPPPESGM